jgi:hypothetical protein
VVHKGAQCHQTGADGRQDAHQIRVSARLAPLFCIYIALALALGARWCWALAQGAGAGAAGDCGDWRAARAASWRAGAAAGGWVLGAGCWVLFFFRSAFRFFVSFGFCVL